MDHYGLRYGFVIRIISRKKVSTRRPPLIHPRVTAEEPFGPRSEVCAGPRDILGRRKRSARRGRRIEGDSMRTAFGVVTLALALVFDAQAQMAPAPAPVPPPAATPTPTTPPPATTPSPATPPPAPASTTPLPMVAPPGTPQ